MSGYLTKLYVSLGQDFGSQMLLYASMTSICKKTGLTPIFIQELVKERYGFPIGEPFNHKISLIPLHEISDDVIYDIEAEHNVDNHIDKRLFYLENDKNYNIAGELFSYEYFHDIKEDILDIYTFNDDIKDFCIDYINNIKSSDEILVSIHFRRGDYLQVSSLNLSLEYYYAAVDYIKSKFPNKKIKYLIFSNGMDWVKENFKLDNCVYVEGLDRFKDMCLMTLCNHNIIANSTFSWWGAYLNQNKDNLTICPFEYLTGPGSEWINGNYYPPEWVALNKK